MNKGVWQRWAHTFFFSVVSLVIGGAVGYFGARPHNPNPVTISTLGPTAFPTIVPTVSPIRVYVSGAVAAPGVYKFLPGTIVEDAIRSAGGAAPDADLVRINLALELQDQQHVHIPCKGETSSLPFVSGELGDSLGSGGLLNINVATAAELEELPGIGPSTARKTRLHKQTCASNAEIEDLQNVSGIGEATVEGLRDLITTE